MQTYFVGPWELSSATAVLPRTPAEGRILLIESTGKGAALPWHRWKLVLVLSALRHLRDALRAHGFEVDHRVAPSYAEGILAHAQAYLPTAVVVQEPAEWGISQSIRALAGAAGRAADPCAAEAWEAPLEALPAVSLRVVPDQRFLVSRADFCTWARGRKVLRMEDFYRQQRRRLGILMEADGSPLGGAWNLDTENRQTAARLRRHGLPAAPRGFAPDARTQEVMELVAALPGKWGSVEGFDLPVTRAQALAALDDFLAHRLRDFGPFEDAMLAGEVFTYHSRLSAAMNVGLLHPREIVQRTLAAWRAAAERIPLSSVEGFIRQIIGWREYVNGVYWREIPAYRAHNYFGFERPLPQAYWDPEATALACLSDTVRMVRDHAYAHHIHRLMVLCSFATLTQVHPLRLSEWFWAAFADASEWVQLPNVVGMGTFGDGGLLASKPYVSAASYISRMSDYCGRCRYDPAKRTGPDACPFNYLYWTFLDDIRQRGLGVGQRMALSLKNVERLDPAELAAMHAARDRFLADLQPDQTGWTAAHDQG